MTIYFNQAYSSRPYVDYGNGACFGAIHCGLDGLLSIFKQYAAIATTHIVSAEERRAIYHNNMQARITKDDLFYKSFRVDSIGTSNCLLAWRDQLVAAGWDMQSWGSSDKLKFLHDMEPKDFPCAEADGWGAILRLGKQKALLPDTVSIVVTQHYETLEPRFAALFRSQEGLGVKIVYRPIVAAVAEGNLGKIQKNILLAQRQMFGQADSQKYSNVNLSAEDDSFNILRFNTEDDAMRYVALQDEERWSLHFCQQRKRFDNTLRLVGQATCGSMLEGCIPQVVQLFTIGNGLFEYPINVTRILAWLNAPINPIKRPLRRALSRVITSSGGIGNEVWNEAINEYFVCITDERDQAKQRKNFEVFMPISCGERVDKEQIIVFNRKLRDWTVGLTNMEQFPFSEIVREQLQQIETYCNSLISMVESHNEEITSLKLYQWCQNIAKPNSYRQYEAEAGCVNAISSEGDIHDTADHVVWFCASDSDLAKYPYDFLNDEEYNTLIQAGVYLYSRDKHSQMAHYAMSRLLLNARKITIVEADTIDGTRLKRHPLILQLEQMIENGLEPLMQYPSIEEKYRREDSVVDNAMDDSQTEIVLDDDVSLKERWTRGSDESYSSIDLLIQHPLDYVCTYNAKIEDVALPSMDDVNRTMGNVAHRIIEKVFREGTVAVEQKRLIDEEYDKIFEQAIDEVGLVLRGLEFKVNYNTLYARMKTSLRDLWEVIVNEKLTVESCEYKFNSSHWSQAGENVTIGSRVDMLLKDKFGGKVIFDFKWSAKSKKYKNLVADDRALQLAIYKHLAQKEFGRNVRTAYVLLPSVEIFTADRFNEIRPIPAASDTAIERAANTYALRWAQFRDGRIECVEGMPIGAGEYGEKEQENPMEYYPLDQYNGVYSENLYTDYKKLR